MDLCAACTDLDAAEAGSDPYPAFTAPPWDRWHPAPAVRDVLRQRVLDELHAGDLVVERDYL